MPFDGDPKNHETKPLAIDAAIALIGEPRAWCKGALRNAAGQHCILGALVDANALDAFGVVSDILKDEGWGECAIPRFNNDPDTTHADVMRVLHRARELLTSP